MTKPGGEKKKRKKSKKATITDRADAIFGQIVRAPGYCCNCGSTDTIQCAHGFSRSYRSVRWDTRNAFPLCRACHFHFTQRPLEWDEWLRNKWGEDLYAEIRALALAGEKVDMPELIESLRATWSDTEAAA